MPHIGAAVRAYTNCYRLQSRFFGGTPHLLMLATTLNIAGYRFVHLDDPHAMRALLFERARAHQLLGTVLLAEEGINLCLAGAPAAVRSWLAELECDLRLAGLDLKTSLSDAVPFKRLIVKVKPEIIRMNQPLIRPLAGRAPVVNASTLARWLDAGTDDAGRPLLMLDTRNAFEVDAGRFHGAADWRLVKFSDFPQALATYRAELEGKTVVSYCTGGIRCEKAALLMADAGVKSVFQLEGGILRYLEATGGAHFDGNCFVFDERETLDAALAPTQSSPASQPR